MLVLKSQNIQKRELSEKNPNSLRTSKPKESLMSGFHLELPLIRNDRSHVLQYQNDNS